MKFQMWSKVQKEKNVQSEENKLSSGSFFAIPGPFLTLCLFLYNAVLTIFLLLW